MSGITNKYKIYEESTAYKDNNCCECWASCIFSCCLPSLVWSCCCCIPCCSSLTMNSKETASRWLIKNNGACVSPFTCCCYFVDLLYDCKCSDTREFFLRRFNYFRSSQDFYCTFNKVVIWDQEQCEQLLASEQCRGPYLGATDFHSRNLPHGQNGRKLFILEMSGKSKPNENPNNNFHKLFYKAVLSLFNSPQCIARIHPENPVMKKFIKFFQKDISDTNGDNQALVDVAIPRFLVRSLHWGILNVEFSQEEFDQVYSLYYNASPSGPRSVLYHLKGSGPLMSVFTSIESQYKKVAKIYKRSPVLAAWASTNENGMLNQDEIIQIIQRAFTVAGLQGPLAALSKIIVRNVVPKDFNFPVTDRNKMRLVILESMRLFPPVNSTCVVTDAPLTCPYASGRKKCTFPPGTPLLINFVCQGQDENVYPNPTKFDPYGRSEQLWGPTAKYTLFNGVGDKGPRLCPGREIALELMITILQTSLGLVGEFKSRVEVAPINSELIASTVDIITVLSLADEISVAKWVLKCDVATKAWIDVVEFYVNSSLKERPATSISVFNEKDFLPKLPKVFSDPSNSSNPVYIIKFAESDEEEGDLLNKKKSIFEVSISNDSKYISNEKLFYFNSRQEAINVGKEKFKKSIPKYEVVWEDMNNENENDSFSALFFYGIGMQYIERFVSSKHKDSIKFRSVMNKLSTIEPHYIADFSFLSKYSVRAKYSKYGATVYFNSNRVPIAIWIDEQERVVVPTDGDSWVHAKAVARSSLVTAITLVDHLAHCHWITSNGVQLAVRETLSATHPLRRLLKPHIFRAAAVNYSSIGALLPVHGLAYKVFGVAASSWDQALYDALSLYKYQTFPDFIHSKGFSSDELKTFPLAEDGLEYWNIVHKYVSNYMSIFYPSEDDITNDSELQEYWLHYQNSQTGSDLGIPKILTKSHLLDHTTYCIFQVTGVHEFLGSVTEYLTDPSVLPSKVSPNSSVADVQSYFLALSLISLTGIRQPQLMSNWSHLHEYLKSNGSNKYDSVIKVLNSFQGDLLQQSQMIDKRNKIRLSKKISNHSKGNVEEMSWNAFNSFNPRVMECSVSI